MLYLHIKTYNNSLLINFINTIKNHSKLKKWVNFVFLPSKRKTFIVRKSPHVFGRSKEKYYLKTYLASISFKCSRKKDILTIFLILKSLTFKEGLGLKFRFF